jgi:hypothetical protein
MRDGAQGAPKHNGNFSGTGNHSLTCTGGA